MWELVIRYLLGKRQDLRQPTFWHASDVPTTARTHCASNFNNHKSALDNHRILCNQLPVHVGSVYALRSINYRTSDVLVCLKAHGKDDGSMIFAWKLLKKFEVPTLTSAGGPAIGGTGGGQGR